MVLVNPTMPNDPENYKELCVCSGRGYEITFDMDTQEFVGTYNGKRESARDKRILKVKMEKLILDSISVERGREV